PVARRDGAAAAALTNHPEGDAGPGGTLSDRQCGPPASVTRGHGDRRGSGPTARGQSPLVDRRHRRVAARPRDTEPDDRHRSECVPIGSIAILPIAEPAKEATPPALHPSTPKECAGVLGARGRGRGRGDAGDRRRRRIEDASLAAVAQLAEAVVPRALHPAVREEHTAVLGARSGGRGSCDSVDRYGGRRGVASRSAVAELKELVVPPALHPAVLEEHARVEDPGLEGDGSADPDAL